MQGEVNWTDCAKWEREIDEGGAESGAVMAASGC